MFQIVTDNYEVKLIMSNKIYLTDVEVGMRYGVSRTTPWRWVSAGIFPKPLKISPGCTRWSFAELVKHDAEKAAS